MKTLELLDKYRKILSPILNCKEEDIKFYSTRTIYKETGKEERLIEIGTHFEEDYDKGLVTANWSEGEYQVCYNSSIISTWKLYQLPHCCAYIVSCSVNVREDYRSKRIGTILNQLRQDIGRLLGYSAIICTDIEQNTNQRKLLKTNGWKDVHNIINKRTNNRVYLSVVNI